MADEENAIQGVLIEQVDGVSHLPDGKIAVVARSGGGQVGLVFEREDATELAELLTSATGGAAGA